MHSPLVDHLFSQPSLFNKNTLIIKLLFFSVILGFKTVKSHITKNMLPSRIANK